MKSTFKLFGIIALIAVIGFSIAACSDSIEENTILISGTLSGGKMPMLPNALYTRQVRSAAQPEASAQTFYAKVKPDNSIEGMLQDGAAVFLLEARFDPQTRGFTMQTSSSNIIFSIVGMLNSNNTLDTSRTRASVKVRDTLNNEWETIDLAIASGN